VVVHASRWWGAVVDCGADVEVAGDGCRARVGGSTVQIDPDGYTVTLDAPDHGVRGRFRVAAGSTPYLRAGQPFGAGWMSWLFVPRSTADGSLTVDGVRVAMRAALCYHDHNWGSFRWGDDVGWQWASMVPLDRDVPWTAVLVRMTDRSHSAVGTQWLYVWHDAEPAAMFRDRELVVEQQGLLRRPAGATLPAPLALVVPGSASDVPATLTVTATSGRHHVCLRIDPEEYARLTVPADVGGRPVVTLLEIPARMRLTGEVGGTSIDVEGRGVLEHLR
jgi:hypothetical protein